MPPRREVRLYRSPSKVARPVDVAVIHRPIERFGNYLITIGRQAKNRVGAAAIGEHSDWRLSDIRKPAERIIPRRRIGENVRPENARAIQAHAARDAASRHIRRGLWIE